MEKKQEEKNTEKVKKRTSLKNIIGGDILATDFFRRQAGLLFLIMVLIIIYINNRYECQLQLIEIDNLKKGVGWYDGAGAQFLAVQAWKTSRENAQTEEKGPLIKW